MAQVLRLAAGTLNSDGGGQSALWAFLDDLQLRGAQIQGYSSRACFTEDRVLATITGRPVRHLDSWLMSQSVCRDLFLHGSRNCDLAVVEGSFRGNASGNGLALLCDWLNLPALGIVDVSELARCRIELPSFTPDALLLANVPEGCAGRWIADLESLWGIPVVGAIETGDSLHSELRAAEQGNTPSRELRTALLRGLRGHWHAGRAASLLARRSLPTVTPSLFRPIEPERRPHIALAYDGAFDCYYPDVIDLFESRGAVVSDFSPLSDERLPDGADIVFLGSGHVERHAVRLERNHCMKLAIRDHLCRGRRIYAEGRGLAYLCQELQTPEGATFRMAGLFPALARVTEPAFQPVRNELTLGRTTWFGHEGARLRGYHDTHLQLTPLGSLCCCAAAPADHQAGLVEADHAIGSQATVHFAAQPDLLHTFFHPNSRPPQVLDPWASKP